LVLSEPHLAFLRNDIKDFALCVHQVGIASFLSGLVDVELEERRSDKEHRRVIVSM